MIDAATRLEHDLIGDRNVPASAYWGIHTLRASENFRISGQVLADAPGLVIALAWVKQAAAEANLELGLISEMQAKAIIAACREIQTGALIEQFIVDLIQGGAGTSSNMNANEVIANRALEILGHARGSYAKLHPNDHVNLGQSTNDVYPTALRLAAWKEVQALILAMASLRRAFTAKAEEFSDVLKMGRTQLQDAVPMTLGQEFATYARMLGEDEARLAEASLLICEINMGATAIGTGIASHPGFSERVCQRIARISGVPVVRAADLIEATQDCGAFVQLSGVLKRVAVKLSKVCNDLRLLSSGPQAGLGEINLPPRQAGSSIMPGKVNPVIPEVVNQIAFEVIGNDMTITMAAEAGQLQLNAFEPIIFFSLHRSLTHLAAGCATLEANCIAGITANRDRLRQMVETSAGLVTALNPKIGYQAASEVAREALASNRSVRDIVIEKGLMSAQELDTALNLSALTGQKVTA